MEQTKTNTMKMKITLSMLFIGIVALTYAQDWSTSKYQYGSQYEGYVIDAAGNKIEGFIKYRNRSVMQEEVIFYKQKDNSSTKKKYLVKDLKAYKVADKEYHVIRYSGNSSYKAHGVLVKNGEGCIKEYIWYELASGHNTLKKRPGESDEDFGNRKFPSKAVYHKKGDDIGVDKKFFEADFKKNMTTYVKTDKALAKKVKSGTSGYTSVNDLRSIFDEFNKNCQ